MLKKNDVITTVIDGMGCYGEGIARVDGQIIFVPFALATEKVVVKIIHVKKSFAYGKLIEVITPAEARVRESCPVFGKCGGCQLQHLKYQAQLKIKTKIVTDSLHKIAKIDVQPENCMFSEKEFRYRNKLQVPVGLDREGKTVIGFYAANSHRIIPVKDCLLQPKWNSELIECLLEFMNKYKVPAYDEIHHKGIIRHLVAREIFEQFLITIVVNDDNLPFAKEFYDMLKERFGENVSLCININTQSNNVVLTDETYVLFGNGRISFKDFGLNISIGSNSFLQVNNAVKERIYFKVLDIIKKTEYPVVIDAYSGAGVLSGIIAPFASEVYGIEIVNEAVRSANELAETNAIRNMKNICGDCTVVLPKLITAIRERMDVKNNYPDDLIKLGEVNDKYKDLLLPDTFIDSKNLVLVLDPPRKGCDLKELEAVKNCSPDKIIYISCNPATLARDIGFLTGNLDLQAKDICNIENETSVEDGDLEGTLSGCDYEVTFVRPYDMFPQTRHVETLICLTKKS